MRKIIIYSGGFHPFGPHHFKAYKWLCERFNGRDVYIVTSNHITPERPLSFLEKKAVIAKYGIDLNAIVCCKNPYKADELLSNFDATNTCVIFAYGEKDLGRINFVKADGSPSYLTKYFGQLELQPMSERGYVITIPNFDINDGSGQILSGTRLRQILPHCTDQDFKGLMGWYDRGIHNLFKEKFYNAEIKFESLINKSLSSLTENRITKTQLMRIEQYADRLFKEFGIDIEFQNLYKDTHFYQRLNDPRNIDPITTDELRDLFIKTSKKYGEKLSKLSTGAEGVLKDMQSDINLPFIIKWDSKSKELDLIPKTIMRKKDFKTSTPEYQVEQFQTGLIEGITGKFTKHIQHPHEASNLTFKDIKGLFTVLCTKPSEVPTTLKYDGQNLLVTYINGEWKCARNKTSILKPMSTTELYDMYEGRGDIQLSFVQALKDVEVIFNQIDRASWPKFDNGKSFINIEILNPKTINIFEYDFAPMICVHDIITYNEFGVEEMRTKWNPNVEIPSGKYFKCMITESIVNMPKLGLVELNIFLQRLNTLLRKYKLNETDKIGSLSTNEEFQVLIHKMINSIIQNYCTVNKISKKPVNNIIKRFSDIADQIKKESDKSLVEKYLKNQKGLIALGGLKAINPIEGFVIEWKGQRFKLTGSFTYLNQILGIFKYKT